eukprot:TRINITY_DN63923_c0_g1_i1.p2 TRINITY_DN63923_c0_g1~~TRINITY_DN63923_c0_g1_i1.p2  ORF type:complete len:240 (+),score=23.39 TRINITY_DN63923_c0_g1_i1:311-1030(+)
MCTIFLLADSSPLFTSPDNTSPLCQAVQHIVASKGTPPNREIRASYIGESNGNNEDFYGIFEGAVAHANQGKTVKLVPKMIRISQGQTAAKAATLDHRSSESLAWLSSSSLVLLAGGDTYEGFAAMDKKGILHVLQEKILPDSGKVVIGISAGACQLAKHFMKHENEDDVPSEVETCIGLGCVDYIVDVHDENRKWATLRQVAKHVGGTGLGIPMQGVVHMKAGCIQQETSTGTHLVVG